MSVIREMGIPNLKTRTDQTEEGREWNKMRDAIIGLYESQIDDPPLITEVPRPVGFTPIGMIDLDADGVGLMPGKVHFQQTRRYLATASDLNEAVEVYPTLGGVSIGSVPSPSEELAEGDWEAWCIYAEVETDHKARIEFRGLGTGAPDMDRDEKAIRLCSFEVIYDADDRPTTRVYEQLVSNDLQVWTVEHQWRIVKTGDTTITIRGGHVMWPNGHSNPIVHFPLDVPDSFLSITEDGSIWLRCTYATEQQSLTVATLGCACDDPEIVVQKIYDLASPLIEFRGATVNSPNPPVAGTDQRNVMTDGKVWFELARVVIENGDVQLSAQICDSTIWCPEIVDAYIQASVAS